MLRELAARLGLHRSSPPAAGASAESAAPCRLPPCGEPLFPLGLKPGEQFLYEPPVLPREGEGNFVKFYFNGKWDNSKRSPWVNEPERALPLPGRGNGFDALVDDPVFKDEAEARQVPDAWAWGSRFLIVTERFLEIVRSVDPDHIAVRPVEWRLQGGGRLDQQLYFLDATRKLPAIDFANSRVRYENIDGRLVVSTVMPWRAMPDLPADAHIFRDKTKPGSHILISRTLRDALERAEPKLRGVAFDDIATPGGGL